ncbi:MAG: preprotein translocase subunit SecB [Gammaproteobacteria bacterium]|jgi:preprotein translocase subunit SecB|nr:preprotein translocase subunit SecB [Gammaproteobacteria bacterium]
MTAEQNPSQIEFAIQKIFTKDVSFESPNSPLVFKDEWQPEANVDINTASNVLEEGQYEVDLSITVTVKVNQKTAFLVEVKQSGIFTIKNVSADQLGHILGAYCPSTLFPYAREAVASIIGRGGFPPLSLAPVNFDVLYQQSLAQQEVKH